MQRTTNYMVLIPSSYIYNTTPSPAQGASQERVPKDFKSQKPGQDVRYETVSFIYGREASHRKCQQYGCLNTT